jgi:hypothetical protein
MPQVGETYVEVRADTSKVGSDIEKGVTQEVKKAEKAVEGFAKSWNNVDVKKAAGNIQDFSKKAAIPATIALGALTGAAGLFAKQAEEAEIAQRRLNQVLTSMGFGDATNRVAAYAEELEKTVAVDGEVIKLTQSKLATFANLTKTVGEAGGAFDRATVAALDLAAAGFGTAEGNAVQLGKALQDPIKGVGALARAGVTFTAQEKAKIKQLVESNQTLAAQDLVLKAIEKQVGGTAAATASDFAKMKIAFENTGESIGTILLPVIALAATALQSFANFAENNAAVIVALGAALAVLAGTIVLVNVATTAYNALAVLTKAVNMALATSFTQLQVALGAVGIALAVAAAAYALIKPASTKAAAATDIYSDALFRNDKATKGAIAELVKTDPVFERVVALMGKLGYSADDLADFLKNGGGEVSAFYSALFYAATEGVNSANALRLFTDAQKGVFQATTYTNAEMAQMVTLLNTLQTEAAKTTAADKALAGIGLGDSFNNASGGADKLKQKLADLRKELKDKFKPAMDAATDVLKKAQEEFADFAKAVSQSISAAFSFGDSYGKAIDNQKALTEATKAQTDAEKALVAARAKNDPAEIATATAELALAVKAVADATTKPLTFFDSLTEQATKAKDFGVLVNRLIAGGLSQAALQQVLDAGVDAGSAIATELLGSADGILKANTLTAEVQAIADQVGLNAAVKWKQAGVDAGTALVQGVDEVLKNYKIRLKSKKLTAKQLAKLSKDFGVSVDLEFGKAGADAPELANGGIFSGRQNAIIGEAGAEAVIPLTRPRRALDLMEQSGLATLARGQGSAVNIESATFVSPIDAQLLAAKVMVAERARSFAQ